MKRQMRRKTGVKIAFLAIVLVGLTMVSLVWAQPGESWPWRERPDIKAEDLPRIQRLLSNYFIGKTITSTLNAILLLYLIYVYYSIYRSTRSSFSLGLIIMSVALFLFAMSNNPLLHWSIGERQLFGAFNLLPDVFTTVAAAVLIYLSRQ